MTKKIARLFLVLVAATALAGAQSADQGSTIPSANEGPSAGGAIQQKELKSDLERMRILLGQMQRNVAFVSPGDSPLKHQFELEIEMWQLLLQDMENKAKNTSNQPSR
jgi:hypothetical protein